MTTTLGIVANDRNNYLSSLDYGNGDKIEYKYDKANQLIRENNQAGGFTHVWTYDDAGNILTRTEYAYTTDILGAATDTVNYSYGNVWGDLLTAYDGQAISYDGVGNPNGIGTQTYTWKHGRQLATLTENGVTWTYTYNADGLRTSRTNGTDTYSYVYNGSNLTQMTKETDTLYFSYDAAGTPMTVTWNGTVYYYVTNIQGDVIAILNSSGATVASYAYDAWGNPIGTAPASGTLAYLNPLRYRSYVYDQETGLYYLQSRYYDPELGRFLNADTVTDGDAGIIGNDLFVYCANNPVNNVDPTGKWIIKSAIKWLAKNVYKPVVSVVRKTLSKINRTFTSGIAVSASPTLWSYSAQAGWSIDTKGNVAFQVSGGANLTTADKPGASVTQFTTVTNAPTIDHLNGMSYQGGLSASATVDGIPVCAGTDVNLIPADEKLYLGTTSYRGLSTPSEGGSPLELHAGMSYTHTVSFTRFNIFDTLESVLDWMENL